MRGSVIELHNICKIRIYRRKINSGCGQLLALTAHFAPDREPSSEPCARFVLGQGDTTIRNLVLSRSTLHLADLHALAT